ncbi:WD40 repeat-like protein [Xylona heveae TC161]|uniref:WD40 repeat-like protein n=1 Tax=Xylona heveae (strain CBS 132557 / TC161) TaxID=1328760 RepID=A0A164ZNX1_XYLHT|nr:WD40 repeat-like protein [Xylona heveae TC161]KZF19325.1 WD40 repeat-like protein [Xylona heveae TC161]
MAQGEESIDTAPRCVGSTLETFNCSVADTAQREIAVSNAPEAGTAQDSNASSSTDNQEAYKGSNFFKSAQWSPDGTCIFTNSEDNKLRTFVLPVDLLETPTTHHLSAYSTITCPEPVYASALYPGFNLQDGATTLALSSIRDHPIQLHSALAPTLLASYPHVCPTTEKFITPHSLLFAPDGISFLAGSDSLISIFDVNRPGEGPFTRMPTIPSKRKKLVGGGVGMKGIVSALSMSALDGLVAAGTFSRCIGLYAAQGRGDCVAVFSVVDEKDQRHGRGLAQRPDDLSDLSTSVETTAGTRDREGNVPPPNYKYAPGAGITQTAWSPCGRYLYVAERKSSGIIVYDIRVTGQKLGRLEGRSAHTNQRLGMDVVRVDDTHEVWAGGDDGMVRVWENAAQKEGIQFPSWEWRAHGDPVGSTAVHPCGTVIATCSGQRKVEALFEESSDSESDSESEPEPEAEDVVRGQKGMGDKVGRVKKSREIQRDNSLKIWSI